MGPKEEEMAKKNKSALKKARQDEKRRLRNKHYKTMVKNAIKEVRLAVEARDLKLAQELLPKAVSMLHKAVSKGVLHWRTAARKASRLSRLVYSLQRSLEQTA